MRVFLLVACLIFTQVLNAETLFEGYSQILLQKAPVGYVVQRFRFDAKKKRFESVYYIRTGPQAGNMSESLQAYANDKFEPISYRYTETKKDFFRSIDATFEKGVMKLDMNTKGNKSSSQVKLPKGAFLSTFLGYLMLSKGLTTGKKFGYQAIAEEDGKVYRGQAYIKTKEKVGTLDAFRVLNKYKNSNFISHMTEKAEVLSTVSPVRQISTLLVKAPHLALKSLPLPPKTLKLLFGNIPKGKKNILNVKAK